jgi:hypothetical protein
VSLAVPHLERLALSASHRQARNKNPPGCAGFQRVVLERTRHPGARRPSGPVRPPECDLGPRKNRRRARHVRRSSGRGTWSEDFNCRSVRRPAGARRPSRIELSSHEHRWLPKYSRRDKRAVRAGSERSNPKLQKASERRSAKTALAIRGVRGLRRSRSSVPIGMALRAAC